LGKILREVGPGHQMKAEEAHIVSRKAPMGEGSSSTPTGARQGAKASGITAESYRGYCVTSHRRGQALPYLCCLILGEYGRLCSLAGVMAGYRCLGRGFASRRALSQRLIRSPFLH